MAYKIFIASYYIPKEGGWKYAASQTIEPGMDALWNILKNIYGFCMYIIGYYRQMYWLNKYTLFFLIFLLIFVLLFKNGLIKSKRHFMALKVIFLCIGPLLIFVATFLPLSILKSTPIRSRVFIAFGGFLFYIGILLLYCPKQWRNVILVLFTVCTFSQYTYMYAYGNALKTQNEYEKYLVYNIAHDLESLNQEGDFNSFSFMGDTPRAVQLRNFTTKYPFFNEIVPVNFGNSTWIGRVWVYHYLQSDLYLSGQEDGDINVVENTEPVLSNSVYSCYIKDEKIIVRFH